MSVNVRNQRRALEALLSTNTITEAAELCGLTTKTLSRYLQDPAFAAELDQREIERLGEVRNVLLNSRHEALQVLKDIWSGKDTKDNDKRLAVCAWIDYIIRLQEVKVDARLHVLEALVDGLIEDRRQSQGKGSGGMRI